MCVRVCNRKAYGCTWRWCIVHVLIARRCCVLLAWRLGVWLFWLDVCKFDWTACQHLVLGLWKREWAWWSLNCWMWSWPIWKWMFVCFSLLQMTLLASSFCHGHSSARMFCQRIVGGVASFGCQGGRGWCDRQRLVKQTDSSSVQGFRQQNQYNREKDR